MSFGGVMVGLQVVCVEMKSWGDSGEAEWAGAGDVVAANLGSLLPAAQLGARRSEEHTSELQSLS